MQIAEDLVEVLPFWTPDVTANLLWSQPCPLEERHLLGGNIVIEQDHAAVFVLGSTSRTIPFLLRRVSQPDSSLRSE